MTDPEGVIAQAETEKLLSDRHTCLPRGHSMVGAEFVRQVALDPQPPQAAVVIGGGGRVQGSAQAKAAPWLIAAGELDFGRSGAKALHTRLVELGCRAEYRDYPAIEHMVIVQAALSDVFTFLDRIANGPQ